MLTPIRSLRSLKAALTTATALIALAFAAPASADIPPPEVEQCSGKDVGASCGDDKTCQNGTCARATPDGMSEYGCIKCLASADPAEPATPPASAKKNCSSAPDALALGLLGVLAVGFVARRRTA